MKTIKYVGPLESVVLFDGHRTVEAKFGHPIEVDDEQGEALLRQSDVWRPAKRRATTKATEE